MQVMISIEDLRKFLLGEFRETILKDFKKVIKEELLNFLEKFIEEEEISKEELKEIKKVLEEYKRGEYVTWKELKKELLK